MSFGAMFFLFEPGDYACGRFPVVLRLHRLSVGDFLPVHDGQAWVFSDPFQDYAD
jgi:hypothetical protein